MAICCAYCEQTFLDFCSYKVHLKVYHNKKTYGDKLICGQNCCPRDFTRFQTLKSHIIKVHNPLSAGTSVSCVSNKQCHVISNAVEVDELLTDDCDTEPLDTESKSTSGSSCLDYLRDNIDSKGVLYDAALFVSKLRSNPKITQTSVDEIIQSCTDMTSSAVSAVKQDMQSLIDHSNISSEKRDSLLQVLDLIQNPFVGVDTAFKQSRYLQRNGFYVEPQSFLIESYIVPAVGDRACQVKKVTGEFISLKDVLQKMFSLPGVLSHVESYLRSDSNSSGLISDFRDGMLWTEHPVRIRHLNDDHTIVIPVFDFFDDLETANALGSHAVIHKIGVKYTVVKGFSPLLNSKLENILLNMICNSSERNVDGVFDVYLNEMSDLETEGFSVTDSNGCTYKIYVVLVQVIGDNLGLNGLLGYVESFTANHPCRICKVSRGRFNDTFTEDETLVRTKESYDYDVVLCDPSVTGIKQNCVYNVLPTFHVTDNVYCDIMHDICEGVCRYVISSLLNNIIFEKKLFSIDMLNERRAQFVFDHSSPPPPFSTDNIKKLSLNLSAMEMLNLVLGFNLMVGDLVPLGDAEWEIYLMLRMIVLYCCGLAFTEPELEYLSVIIAEFLQEYRSVFDGTLTLKFHNMLHYPRVIRLLGPLYSMWVMRCEAKHAELKKVAQSTGNFRNICRTLAVRHQLRQAERLMSGRCFDDAGSLHLPQAALSAVCLSDLKYGQRISELLGHYGLFRELFRSDCVTVSSVCYRKDDVLVHIEDETDMLPTFLQIRSIYITDSRDCWFVCNRLQCVQHNHHYQAYEVLDSCDMVALSSTSLQHLPSPWPLKLRSLHDVKYVSLRHKI